MDPTLVECDYSIDGSIYECAISHITASDDLSQSFVFIGNHLPDKSDANVTHVYINNASVPIVMSDLFRSFPNLRSLISTSAGLTHIQSNAIVNSDNLLSLVFGMDPMLNEIEANAFVGAKNVQSFVVRRNNISQIHPKAFVGLGSVMIMDLRENRIQSLPQDVFKPLRSLAIITMNDNFLEVIDAQLFLHNRFLFSINFNDNQINYVERGFMQSMPFIETMNFKKNICINKFHNTALHSAEEINEDFAKCFDNFDKLERNPSEPIEIECTYSINFENLYQCEFGHITIPDRLGLSFVFTGNHLPDRSDADVTQVLIENATIPIIINDLFKAFPNLRVMISLSGGLSRIQSNAVINGKSLVNFVVASDPTLDEIESHAFAGATNLRAISIRRNSVSKIHEKAFVGLEKLTTLDLRDNKIKTLPEEVFTSLQSLEIVTMQNNLLEVIDASLFLYNPMLFNINFMDNQINAVERSFLKSLPSIKFMNFHGNICIDTFHNTILQPIEIILEDFATCFVNFDDLD
jgi:Leucine-rich repeat (LRR) protein